MKKESLFILVLVVALAASAGAQTPAEDGVRGDYVEGSIDLGARITEIDGSREKAEEYRDLQNGFLIQDFSFLWESGTTRDFLDITIKKPFLEDEFYELEGGAHGKYKYRFFYDSIPHTNYRGNFVFSGFGSNYLTIPDSTQQSLEAIEQTRAERGTNPLTDATGEDAAARPLVNSLYAGGDNVVFKVDRKQTGFEYEYDLRNDMKAWLKLKSERRNGAKRISVGTYERFPQTGVIPNTTNTHTADLFLVNGIELAEPVDYLTTSISAGVGLYKKAWLADFEYTFTDFKNELLSLRWDNPFRITDNTATNATGGATGPGDNGFNRGRFAMGQLALPPDSTSHDFRVSASLGLPMRSNLALTVGYGWITQEEAFLPYTLNSAMSGVGGAPANITDPAILPAGNLDGDVSTLSSSIVLNSRPADPLDVTLKYRCYDYDDKSSIIQFPGYAAFGESYWRTKRNDPGVNNVRNEPFQYRKQTADLGVDYHLSGSLAALIEGGWETWDYEDLRLDSSTEYSAGGGLRYSPSRSSSVKVVYKHAERNAKGYKSGATAENPEAIGLENFNWADRERDKIEARYQVMPWEPVTVGIMGQYLKDDYGEDSRFGLKEVKDYSAGIDIAYSPAEAWTIYTNYAREYRKDFITNGAKDDPFNVPTSALDDPFSADQFNPFNYWNTDIRDAIDTVGVGVRWQIVPNSLAMDTSYNFSFGKTRFSTYNPNAAESSAALGGQEVKLANAAATSWPRVINRFHEVRVNLAYTVTKNLSAGLGYLYERYKLNDFQWGYLDPYMAGATAENSTRVLFTDATFAGYEAHVGTVSLKYTF